MQILKDENGNSFIINKNGTKQQLRKDTNGNEYILDEKGNK